MECPTAAWRRCIGLDCRGDTNYGVGEAKTRARGNLFRSVVHPSASAFHLDTLICAHSDRSYHPRQVLVHCVFGRSSA